MYYETSRNTKCFACGRTLGKAKRVDTRDGQTVLVGPDCYLHIVRSGSAGYQPPQGGPKLWTLPDDPDVPYALQLVNRKG